MTGAKTQSYGKPGKRHGAEYYRNNRRTPRTEEQAGDIPTGGGRPLLSMSGQRHGSMAKAAREEHHGLAITRTA